MISLLNYEDDSDSQDELGHPLKDWTGDYEQEDGERARQLPVAYKEQSLLIMQYLFPLMPIPHARKVLMSHRQLFAPAYLAVLKPLVQLSEQMPKDLKSLQSKLSEIVEYKLLKSARTY